MCRLDLRGGDVIVVLFCKQFPPTIVGNVPYKKGKSENEPLMTNKAKFFPSNYTNRVVHLFTALLQRIVNIC